MVVPKIIELFITELNKTENKKQFNKIMTEYVSPYVSPYITKGYYVIIILICIVLISFIINIYTVCMVHRIVNCLGRS